MRSLVWLKREFMTVKRTHERDRSKEKCYKGEMQKHCPDKQGWCWENWSSAIVEIGKQHGNRNFYCQMIRINKENVGLQLTEAKAQQTHIGWVTQCILCLSLHQQGLPGLLAYWKGLRRKEQPAADKSPVMEHLGALNSCKSLGPDGLHPRVWR